MLRPQPVPSLLPYRRLQVSCKAGAPQQMGRRRRSKRKYKNIQKLYEQNVTQQQQEQQLDQEGIQQSPSYAALAPVCDLPTAAEHRLLSKQLWVTCLTRNATESSVKAEFENRYGGVLQVRINRKDNQPRPGDDLLNMFTSSLNGTQQQHLGPLPRAVIEFTDPAYAKGALNARQLVPIFSGRNGRRTSEAQQVLAAGSVGYLKQPCSCRRYRTPCNCMGYVKAVPNRPTPNQSYHKGGAGEHTLEALNLQIGSLAEDGKTVKPELDVTASCSVTISLQERCVRLTAMLGGSTKHLLVSQFRHLHHSMTLNQQDITLSYTLKLPPKILRNLSYCSTCGCELTTDEKGPTYELCGDPTAAADFGMGKGPQCPVCDQETRWNQSGAAVQTAGAVGVVGVGEAGADGLLGRCLTYKLRLHGSAVDELFNDNNPLMKKLRSFKLLRSAQQRGRQARQGLLNSVTSAIAARLSLSHQPQPPSELAQMLQHLDFDVGYHVLVLLSAGVATPWQVSSASCQQLLQRAAAHSTAMTCKALAELSALSSPIRDFSTAFQEQYVGLVQEAELTGGGTSELRAGQYKVLRVHVTPTRVKFLLPEVQTGNRVVRHFCASTASSTTYSGKLAVKLRHLRRLQFSTGHFLRVSFGDEGGDRLFRNREESTAPFFDRMGHVLQTGVVVNGRKYEFLAYSSSQLRTWSTWMVADPQQGQADAAGAVDIADALRHWLGDAMETERVPAKCAARLGQSFSDTVDAAQVQRHQVTKISDIERPVSVYSSTNYCFSDGVGRISLELLEAVVKALPFAARDGPQISAIQVRFQGCKGVLSRYSLLQGHQLQVRPSMEKFGSDHPQLEVCSVAAWLPAYLNRQVIIMMEFNGVPTQVFLNKLVSLLDQLARMCCSSEAALALLPALGGVETSAQDAMLRLLDVSVKCGLPLDPLADSCLKAVARWQVTDLRQKARLLVPEAVTLVGVMDEYGVLEEDEVFVQVQPPPRGQLHTPPARVISGSVVLAKHPVAHIGDVRRVQAVDSSTRRGGQQLVTDYVNVVVFSQKGLRPLPNKLSGSDLDGDQYMVLWDHELLQPHNSEPMDYTAHPPDKVAKVEAHHLQEHFVNFAKNDNLGQISTWLLAHADANGPDCSECKRLAQLHSMAVDFSKTGRPAALSSDEVRTLRPTKYPHWMEKQDQEVYDSNTVLGQMYDRVLQHPITAHLMDDDSISTSSTTTSGSNKSSRISQTPLRIGYHSIPQAANGNSSNLTWPVELLRVPGINPAYKQHLQQAETRFIEFENDIVGLMNHWDVYNVGEMVTGCLRRLQRRRGQHHQQSEQRDQINRELRGVFTRARNRFLQDLLQLMDVADLDELKMLTLKALDAMVDEKVTAALNSNPDSTFGDSNRLQYAAAYMVVAHKWVIKEQLQQCQQGQQPRAAAGASTAHAAAPMGELVDSEDDEHGESDAEESASEEDDTEDFGLSIAEEQQGSRKQQEVKRLVRLCFQWIVARELQELACLL